MAKKDAAGQTGVPLKTEDEVIEAIERLMPSANGDRTLAFWHVGEKLLRLKAMRPDDAVWFAAGKTGIAERDLRYCKNVREAFTYDRLEPLVKKGLRWSSVRELASESLKPHRDGLIRDFESRCGTDLEEQRRANAELLAEAIALRKGGSGAEQKDAHGSALERRVQRAAARIESQIERLRENLITAGKVLAPAAGSGAPLKPEALARVRTMNAALDGLLAEAAALLRQSTALAGEEGPPLAEPDKARRTTAAQNPGPRPVRARGGKRRQ